MDTTASILEIYQVTTMPSLISKVLNFLRKLVRLPYAETILSDGQITRRYIFRNKVHRENDPAVIRADGTMLWSKDGKLHRDKGPSVISSGKHHLLILWSNNHNKHRINGPAIIWSDGTIEYYVNNKRHRTTGPALISVDGYVEYWINDKKLNELEFFAETGYIRQAL